MRCPICKREVDENERNRQGGTFPFCSERCKLIDLGRWLSDKYQILASDPSAAPPTEDDDE